MKAILAIDIPDDVAEAYGDITVDYDLRGRPKEDGFCYTESIKYVEDCHLKPMPQKREENDVPTFSSSFERGWNACLDEILEETE